MFLSDVADLTQASFARKSYERYLRENKPETYDALVKTRNELSDFVNKQRINKHSKKPVIAVVIPARTPKNNTYKMLKEMGYAKSDNNGIGNGLRQLRNAEERAKTVLPDYRRNDLLPDLAKLERGQAIPELGKPLPDLGEMKWRGKVDVVAAQHNSNAVLNPIKNEVKTTGGRKAINEIIVPKKKIPDKSLLKNLGIAGAVGGGLLGAYGLKKVYDSRKEKN